MKPLVVEHVIEKAMGHWRQRYAPLFDILRELEGKVPEPAIDFDPEDGEMEFVWIVGSVGSVSISMFYEDRYSDRKLTMWLAGETESCWRENPTVSEVLKEVQDLLALIPPKEG